MWKDCCIKGCICLCYIKIWTNRISPLLQGKKGESVFILPLACVFFSLYYDTFALNMFYQDTKTLNWFSWIYLFNFLPSSDMFSFKQSFLINYKLWKLISSLIPMKVLILTPCQLKQFFQRKLCPQDHIACLYPKILKLLWPIKQLVWTIRRSLEQAVISLFQFVKYFGKVF